MDSVTTSSTSAPCEKCSGVVFLFVRTAPPPLQPMLKRNQRYYFNQWLRCSNCGRQINLQRSRRQVSDLLRDSKG